MDKGVQMIERLPAALGPWPTACCRNVTAEVRTDFFDYELPAHLIAQEPCTERDQARLLVLNRAGATVAHRVFHELPELLNPGDLLILNDTRVMPARLVGRRTRTGGKWEGLFLRQLPDGLWELLCQTRGRLAPGETLIVEPGPLQLQLAARSTQGHWLARPNRAGEPLDLLQANGRVPLPPYIRKGRAGPDDRARYQTVFARQPGAVAAPTAGLHFTPRLFERLKQRSIEWAFVTLHVGLGTFQPLRTVNITQHRLHREWGELPIDTVEAIARCRERGNRVVAVGTTSVRVLETVAASGAIRPWSGETDLFIHPPYSFQIVDALVTNFHLPRTSLLLLVSAFAGVDSIRRAYETAVAQEYRFFSYGDAMLIA
jgi:S-adenosylmethionine:tRNA ribosyltransferase-isomerase